MFRSRPHGNATAIGSGYLSEGNIPFGASLRRGLDTQDDCGATFAAGIRFGAVTAEDRPRSPAAAAVYMSKRDASQIIVKAVEAETIPGFAAFYALSDNAARFRDLDQARRLVGFAPQDGILEWPPCST